MAKRMTALGTAFSDVFNDIKEGFKSSRAAGVGLGDSIKAAKDTAKPTFEAKKAEIKELGLAEALKPTKEPEPTPPSEEVTDGRENIEIESIPETRKRITEYALR